MQRSRQQSCYRLLQAWVFVVLKEGGVRKLRNFRKETTASRLTVSCVDMPPLSRSSAPHWFSRSSAVDPYPSYALPPTTAPRTGPRLRAGPSHWLRTRTGSRRRLSRADRITQLHYIQSLIPVSKSKAGSRKSRTLFENPLRIAAQAS